MLWSPAPARRLAPLLLVALLAAACAAACGAGPARTGPNAPPAATVVRPPSAAATGVLYQDVLAEGEVRVYADLDPRETDGLARLVGQRYPGLTVRWTHGLDRDLLARALAETDDPVRSFDVFVGDAGTLLKTAGLADRWNPPEAGALRPGLFDPEGNWYAVAATHWVLQYHTEQVPPASRPTRYEQLAHPGYLGRLAVEEEALAWLKGLVEIHGRQPTVDALRPLGGQAVVVRREPRTLADFVSAGRHAVAVANRLDAVERAKRDGAKTDWAAIEPIVVQPTVAVAAARAPHPNAARLFLNFLLSADAQHLLAQHGRVPSRLDVDPEPQTLVRGLRTHLTLPPEGDAEQELRTLYADLWRPR